MRSLDQFFDPASLQVLTVIVPDDEYDGIKKALDGASRRHRILVLPEADLDLQTRLEKGWFRQQLIKLKMATKVESPFFLVLDADVICCKPVSYTQLIPNGRALLTRSRKTVQPDWWKWSAELLRTPPKIWTYDLNIWKLKIRTPGPGMGVTPAILSTTHTLELIDCLQTLWHRPLGELLNDHRFTEYTLYYLFLEMNGLVDRVHQTDLPVRCSGKGTNVYNVNDVENWNVDRLFTDMSQPGFFTVFQSNAAISPEIVWEKIRPYLGNQA